MSRTKRLRPLAGLLAAGFAAPAVAAPSQPYPTYTVGPQSNGSIVVSNGSIITPAGTQVNLGSPVRAKAVAVNPAPGAHTAAVLTEGGSTPLQVFDTRTGQVLQKYLPFKDSSGSYGGVAYSADGSKLMLSQDDSYVTVANVGANGLLSDAAHVSVPPDTSFISCFPNSPIGDYGEPCGQLYSTSTSYPGGLAFAANGKTAYALLSQNNTLAPIDLSQATPTLAGQIRVGNAPNSILINGNTAYVSNEGGRVATANDFQVLSAGTPIVADPTDGFSTTGTVSVVDLNTNTVTATIPTGLHPTGMAMYGYYLLVSNTYDDTISVIDTRINRVVRTISLKFALPVPGKPGQAYGKGPTAIAVDAAHGIAYVALYNANAIEVVNLSGSALTPFLGFIPVGYAPGSLTLDTANNQLLVANDKGTGTQGSKATDHGVTSFNSHQDTGTVSIIPLGNLIFKIVGYTAQVVQNNHWDLLGNFTSAGFANPHAAPVAIPAHIGEPSTIKHVFLIVRENRTYDQMLGDVAAGNGDASLAVFGGQDTPNVHNLIKRFPLLDNFYDPSRQSADGHQYITEAMAPYADDIQSPDWVRSYPGGNAGDSLAYLQRGFLWSQTVKAGLRTKLYGEYVENEDFPTSQGHPTWSQFYADSKAFEAGTEPTLQYQNSIVTSSSVPSVESLLIKNFPDFDLNIPDQYRVDIWLQDFNKDLAAGTVPSLSILWVMDDHTGGPPTVHAEEADNDLAVGRIIDTISHSSVWKDSAIFMEEDDAQDGVDHVDGHRSPGYVVSPYAVQYGPTDHTNYTQVNMTRTIEQILGLPPMNRFDLLATPMYTDFTNTPNFTPWTHLPNIVPLDMGVAVNQALNKLPASPISTAWADMKVKMFAGKTNKADSVDPDLLNHYDWYEATSFKRPYPGEKAVRMPSEFTNKLTHPNYDIDD